MTDNEKKNIYNAIQNLYNMDFTSWQEVLAMMYNLVSDTTQKFDVFEQRFIVLLGKEVSKTIRELHDNGQLADIINVEVFKNLNSKIENVYEQLDNISRIDCVWVETWGNDNTGKVNKMNKPVATLDKALDLLPNGGNIYIGHGRFKSPSFNAIEQYSKIGNNHNFFGSGMPIWKSDKTGMLDGSGTILEGSFVMINTNNNICRDFGIDVGEEVCNRLFRGTAQEGFITVSVWGLPTTLLSPNYGKGFKNISVICKDVNSPVHAFLCEGVINANVENIKTLYGTHGIVFKSINSNINGLFANEHFDEGVIIRSSNYAKCYGNNINNVVIISVEGNCGGLILSAIEPNEILYGNNISNVVIKNAKFGLKSLANANNNIFMNQFNNITLMDINGLCYDFENGLFEKNTFKNCNSNNKTGKDGMIIGSMCKDNIFDMCFNSYKANNCIVFLEGSYNNVVNLEVTGYDKICCSSTFKNTLNVHNMKYLEKNLIVNSDINLIEYDLIFLNNSSPIITDGERKACSIKCGNFVYLKGNINIDSGLPVQIAKLNDALLPNKTQRFLLHSESGMVRGYITITGQIGILDIQGSWVSLDNVICEVN